jgi:hypothetical protein
MKLSANKICAVRENLGTRQRQPGMSETTVFTILAMPKPFRSHIGIIQRNAITSWTMLRPRPAIYLFGEEEGVAEIAAELRISHLRDIARNEFGTPPLDDLLGRPRKIAGTSLLYYVNSDIILLQEFIDAVSLIHAQFPKVLGVAHRLNIELSGILDFARGGEMKLRSEILPLGTPGNPTAIDVFVFPSDSYQQISPFAIGRAWFDQWLIKEARRQRKPVVDMTQVTRAIHQNHDYGYHPQGMEGVWKDEEARHNLELPGGAGHTRTIEDAEYKLEPTGIVPNKFLWLAPTKRRWWDMSRAVRGVLRTRIWHPLLDASRSIRHAVGLKRNSVPTSFAKPRTAALDG